MFKVQTSFHLQLHAPCYSQPCLFSPSNSYLASFESLFEVKTRARHQTQPEKNLSTFPWGTITTFKTSRDVYLWVCIETLSGRLFQPLFWKLRFRRKRNIESSRCIRYQVGWKNGGKSKGHGFRLRPEVVWLRSTDALSRKERLARERCIHTHRTKLLSWKKKKKKNWYSARLWYNVIVNGVIVDVTRGI